MPKSIPSSDLAELRRRVSVLSRGLAVAFILAVVGFGLALHQRLAVPTVIKAQGLLIVDSHGETRAELAAHEQQTVLRLVDGKATPFEVRAPRGAGSSSLQLAAPGHSIRLRAGGAMSEVRLSSPQTSVELQAYADESRMFLQAGKQPSLNSPQHTVEASAGATAGSFVAADSLSHRRSLQQPD